MRAKEGDKKAHELLIKHNLRYVVEVAKSYQGQGLSLEELVAEGNLGICKAANKFDPTRGVKFITYAVWWIRQAILQALSDNTRTVRIPINRINEIQKNRKIHEKEIQKSGGLLSEHTTELNEMYSAYPVSLNSNTTNDQPILELFINKDAIPTDDLLNYESLKIDLETILENLNQREITLKTIN